MWPSGRTCLSRCGNTPSVDIRSSRNGFPIERSACLAAVSPLMRSKMSRTWPGALRQSSCFSLDWTKTTDYAGTMPTSGQALAAAPLRDICRFKPTLTCHSVASTTRPPISKASHGGGRTTGAEPLAIACIAAPSCSDLTENKKRGLRIPSLVSAGARAFHPWTFLAGLFITVAGFAFAFGCSTGLFALH